jgi:hypothetical protein
MKRASYEPMAGGRYFTLFILAVLLVGGVFLIVKTVQGGPKAPPPLFAAACVAALIWNGYWWLWRVSCRLEAQGSELRWKTPLRSGSAQIADITAIRAMKLTPQISIIEIRGQRNVMVQTIRGFSEFADYISKDSHIHFRSGPLARLSQGFGSRNGFNVDA